MTLIGSRLGRYEIQSAVGAGGMGEVYCARDPELNRAVAIKIIPASLARDAARVKRFQQEARAAAALNHPNILAVYDLGTEDDSPYIVSEFLEGETLRAKLVAGPVPARKAIDYTIQVARGLAAAHDKGIVHRDLKPENVFVTRDGGVKILDFGLAKLFGAAAGNDATRTVDSDAHSIVGTVGYMSPEQARGQQIDGRSDLFSLGAILYEMLSGKRAFRGESTADTISAILHHDPPEISSQNARVPPALDRIVRHCLEKSPDERFQSARDLAFGLESLSASSGAIAAGLAKPRRNPRTLLLFSLLLVVLSALGLIAARTWLGARSSTPDFHRLTYRHGTTSHARFAPDGETLVYAAAWEGKPVEVFSGRLDSPESRSLGIPGADLLAISRSGELAVQLERKPMPGFYSTGTLARLSLSGGGPREVLDGVEYADWSPQGELAVVRQVSGKERLEFPVGKVLYETAGWIGDPRFSPNGDLIAFFDHPNPLGDHGDVALVDLSGSKKTLSSNWSSAQGLAWSPDGKEVWFTANRSNTARQLQAVSPTGRERTVYTGPTNLMLHDIAPNGRVLFSRLDAHAGTVVVNEAQKTSHDLSWHDWSVGRPLSPDGSTLLISESGEAVGPDYACYLRKVDGSPAIKLGDNACTSFTPDGKWVVGLKPQSAPSDVFLLPVGAGEPRRIHFEGGLLVTWAAAVPDGKRLLVVGHYPNHGSQIYVQELSGGSARAISAEGTQFRFSAFTPDGGWVAGTGKDRAAWLFSLAGAEAKPVRGSAPGDRPVGFSPDGRYLLVTQVGETSARIDRIEISSGRRSDWKVVRPTDPTGIIYLAVGEVRDHVYLYFYTRNQSDLYVVDGLR